jgi:hypothetical protein
MLSNDELFVSFQEELEKNLLFETCLNFDKDLIDKAMEDFESSADYSEYAFNSIYALNSVYPVYTLKPIYEDIHNQFRRHCLDELKNIEHCLENSFISTKLKKRAINIYLRLIEFNQPIVFYKTESKLFTWKISISKSSDGILLKYQNTFDHTDIWIENFIYCILYRNTHTLQECKDIVKTYLSSGFLIGNLNINSVSHDMLHLMINILYLSEKVACQVQKLHENRFYVSLLLRVRE